jgi:hypothetical protein
MLTIFQKFHLFLDENEETKRRKMDEFLKTDIGKAAFWDFENGK